jgi:glycine/D-amino acid oxidase-like deaminating enzyme
MQKSQNWDLIIAGSGIIGCATAFYAARAGLRVLMIERDTPGAAQSGRNLGFVRQQGRDFRELPLAMAALRLWNTLDADIGRKTGFCRGGNIVLATSDDMVRQQQDWQAKARDSGLDTVLLSAREIRQRLPLLSPSATVQGAMFTASDGRAEPGRATRAMFEAALEQGASAILGAPVTKIELRNNAIEGVWVRDLFYSASHVLCAAGTGSAPLLRGVGYHLPQERLRATVVRTHPAPGHSLASCLSLPLTGLRQDTSGAFVYSVAGGEYDLRPDSWRFMRQYRDTRKNNPQAARINYLYPLQRILPPSPAVSIADIAPSSEAPQPEPRRVREAQAEIKQYLPPLADLGIAASWAGIIDTLPDVVPVIGAAEPINGLLVATGFSGHGFGLGPMVGKIMAELACGRPSPVDISGLSPARFTRQIPSH